MEIIIRTEIFNDGKKIDFWKGANAVSQVMVHVDGQTGMLAKDGMFANNHTEADFLVNDEQFCQICKNWYDQYTENLKRTTELEEITSKPVSVNIFFSDGEQMFLNISTKNVDSPSNILLWKDIVKALSQGKIAVFSPRPINNQNIQGA